MEMGPCLVCFLLRKMAKRAYFHSIYIQLTIGFLGRKSNKLYYEKASLFHTIYTMEIGPFRFFLMLQL